jgi:hypothetical protein
MLCETKPRNRETQRITHVRNFRPWFPGYPFKISAAASCNAAISTLVIGIIAFIALGAGKRARRDGQQSDLHLAKRFYLTV